MNATNNQSNIKKNSKFKLILLPVILFSVISQLIILNLGFTIIFSNKMPTITMAKPLPIMAMNSEQSCYIATDSRVYCRGKYCPGQSKHAPTQPTEIDMQNVKNN